MSPLSNAGSETTSRPWPVTLGLLLLICVVPACSKHDWKNRYLVSGNQSFEAEQYDRAEAEYRTVLKLAPLDPVAIGRLGLIYHAEGRLQQAFGFLNKAAELEPGNLEVRLKLGLTYLALRMPKEARAEAVFVLGRQPGNERSQLLLAEASLSPKELEETLQQLLGLPPAEKGKAGYHVAMGTLHLHQQDLARAESAFKQALTLDAKSSAAHLALGTIHLTRNESKQAGVELKAAAELAPLRSGMRFSYADFLLKTGAIEEAKQIISEITRKAPDYVSAWVYLARIAFAERKTDECADLVQKMLTRDPENYDALMLKGALMLTRGEGANAVAHYDRMTALHGRFPQVRYQLALAQLQNNQVGKAIGSLNQAINLNTNYSEPILLLAELNIRKGDSSTAAGALTQLVAQQPQIYQAHLLLAKAYLAQRNPGEAVLVYRRMIGYFSKSAEVPMLLGLALMQQNKRAEAREAFEKSIEFRPDYMPALGQLVDLDVSEKKYPAALKRVQQAMEASPAAAEPWLMLANLHTVQQETSKAEAALLKAIELNRNLQAPYLLLARLYRDTNKHPQALARLAELVEKEPKNVVALMQIGMINEEVKDLNRARDAYEKLLKINPAFSPALNNLAYLYSDRFNEPVKAFEMAERARQLLPYDPSTADTLGWILHKKGEYLRALNLLQESAGNRPDDPDIQFHLGMTHYRMAERESARVALLSALDSGKDFAGKEEARRRLAMVTIEVKKVDATALADLEQKVKEEPNDAFALGLLGAVYEWNGALEKATKAFEMALNRSPKNAQFMNRLAQLYARQNGARMALELAKDAHNLAPEDARISHTLGRLVYESGDHKWAASLLAESASKLPSEPEVLYDLGWSLYSIGRVSDANSAMQAAVRVGLVAAKAGEADRFLAMVAAADDAIKAREQAPEVQKILKTVPGYVPGLMVSAFLQDLQKNYEAEARLLEQVLSCYPFFAPATRNLALLYFEQLGDDKKANELASKARRSFPDDASLARALGILAYRRGEYARSALLLKEGKQKFSNDAEHFYYLGMAHYRLKQGKESKEALQRALLLNVSTKLANEARRVMAELK